ncbi:MAG: hypothetical protein GXO02_03295, partial [Epsilonproteobacteria bacterium]|nr:hypothetical protein [Campylobacterota bacterium]
MGRVVIFVLLFIGFLIIKMVLIGGRKVVEVGAEAFDSVNGTNYSTKLNFYLTPPTLDESIVGLLSIASYESKEIGLVER